jgi:hypothetical protein
MYENPYLILDDILFYYDREKNENLDGRTSISLVELILNVQTDPHTVLFTQALDKLVKEGYLIIEINEEFINYTEGSKPNQYYTLTYEGALLIKDGGYVEKVNSETYQNRRNNFYETVIRIGAIVGGIYALFEIWKNILDLWFHYDFFWKK